MLNLTSNKRGDRCHRVPPTQPTDLAKAAFAQHFDEVELLQAQALGLALPDFPVLAWARQLAIRGGGCPVLLPSVVKRQGLPDVVFKFF